MSGLPFGLTEPLHLDEPFPWRAIVVAILLLWLLARFLRSLRRNRQEPPAEPVPPPVPRSRIAEEIRALRTRYGRSKDFRAGCHELAEMLRSFFEAKRDVPFSTLTVGEMKPKLGDTAVVRFFSLLADLQFSRRTPTKSDFEGACDLALDVTRHGRR